MEITSTNNTLIISNDGNVATYPKSGISLTQLGNTVQILFKGRVVQTIMDYTKVTAPSSSSPANLYDNLNSLIS